MANSTQLGLFVRLEAKHGKEAQVERLIRDGLTMVQQEALTTVWFGIRLSGSTFGIFDAFPNEQARQAHLAGRLAAALMEKAPDLLSHPPSIEKVEVIASKLPGENMAQKAA
jgi:quinol monooxygenase YgiN